MVDRAIRGKITGLKQTVRRTWRLPDRPGTVNLDGCMIPDRAESVTQQGLILKGNFGPMTQAATQNPHILIAGAHIEGLVCAIYLARAGMRVHVVGAPQTPMGEAPMTEFHGEFRTGICSHHPVQISRSMCDELGLGAHGWKEPGLKAPLLAPGARSPSSRRRIRMPMQGWMTN